MKKNKIFKDSRPLEMLDYLDEAYVAEVVDNLDLKNEPGKPLPKKVVVLRSIRTAAVLVACAVLLGAAVPLVGRLVGKIPDILNPAGTVGESSTLEETEPTVDEDLPEEYFTDGILFCGDLTISFGAEYEGKWIHSSTVLATNVKFLAAYDPADGTTKSICVDHPNCFASGKECPVGAIGWKFTNIQVLDDWCLYRLEGGNKYDVEIRMYNMKTGESRVIMEDVENGNIVTYPLWCVEMNGKVYFNLWEVDKSTTKSRREYISCYDPKTDTIEYLCDEPENLDTISISNKRIFYTERLSTTKDPAEVWTTDHSGGNLKKEEVLNFDRMILSGTYAYDGKSVLETRNTFRVYDFETDSISTVDFGAEIRYLLATSSKLCFVFEEDGKVYISDPLGENRELVLDRPGLDFKPYDIIGDYIIGEVSLTHEMTPGTYALNIKTGELKAIPAIN
ncbi:MAG: hypothetical protein IKK74_03765 [Clostridia bacterium]|nr:hypothetical protein [Clostridia bacterium]